MKIREHTLGARKNLEGLLFQLKISFYSSTTTEPIVEIKVNIKIAMVPRCKGTPKPMMYIRRDCSSAEEGPSQVRKQNHYVNL